MMSKFVYDKVGVGSRIQEKRIALCLTQEKVAERVDKSLRFITEIERGAVGMSVETLLSICEVLRTNPNEILFAQQTDVQDDEIRWLTGALESCSENTRFIAMEVMRALLRSVKD